MSITLKTPYYNSLFVDSAKRRSAQYSDNAWHFADADADVVKKLQQKYFGTDEKDQVTLQVTWADSDSVWQHGIEVAGRTVARAFGRDSGAKMGDDIVLVTGAFNSGGSVKNWTTTVSAGTVVLMRHFSKWYAEKLVKDDPNMYKIVDESAPVDVDIEDL